MPGHRPFFEIVRSGLARGLIGRTQKMGTASKPKNAWWRCKTEISVNIPQWVGNRHHGAEIDWPNRGDNLEPLAANVPG
jgi:hypothetical protein